METKMRCTDTTRSVRRAATLLAAAAVVCVVCALPLSAQVAGYGDKQAGEAPDRLPTILQKVTIAQRIGETIPMDGGFRDETGKEVRMGDYFGKRPVILTLVYYSCPMLCSEELNGLAGALEMVSFTPGKDFDIVVVSIDPSEGPDLAANHKALYLKRYRPPETAPACPFLSSPQHPTNATPHASR